MSLHCFQKLYVDITRQKGSLNSNKKQNIFKQPYLILWMGSFVHDFFQNFTLDSADSATKS